MSHITPADEAAAILRGGMTTIHISLPTDQVEILHWAAGVEGRTFNEFVVHHSLDYARLLEALANAESKAAKKGGDK